MMDRKLILSPYDEGMMFGYELLINSHETWGKEVKVINISEVLMSAISMTGVTQIKSLAPKEHNKGKLVESLSIAESKKWAKSHITYKALFEKYLTNEEIEANSHVSYLVYKMSDLLYALDSNSSLFLFDDLRIHPNANLPYELQIPTEILISSIKCETVNLPVIANLDKVNVKRFLEILQSREYSNYSESHFEIGQQIEIKKKTLTSLEKTGRDLLRKNKGFFQLRNSLIQMLPFSSKVVELFLGKLPGIVSEYSSKIITEYLKTNKTLTIYNCKAIQESIWDKRIRQLKKTTVPSDK